LILRTKNLKRIDIFNQFFSLNLCFTYAYLFIPGLKTNLINSFFMKKGFICLNVLALTMCAGVVAYGKAIDENTAKTVGSNYLISNGIQGVNSPSDLSIANVATASVNGLSVVDYYVFNINGAKGFVVVSGDDHVIPILAYSNESSFDINHMSPDAKWWMDGYKNQITYVIENNTPAKASTAEQWTNLKTGKFNSKSAARTTTPFPSSTAHLIQTKWDQEPGYNSDCPSGTPTGCVATAMAGIMQFWNWPTVGCGYHTYAAAGFGNLSADFGNTAYDWATMDANLNRSTSATALLMYHAGVAVNMNYTTTSAGSGSYVISLESPIVNCAEFAFKTYFHYKPTLKGYPRFGETSLSIPAIPDATWDNMIETELNAGRPVIYTGQGSDGGHCWVCDGYNASTMFHFNFGWSGSSNAWYSIDDVAPPALGTGGGSTGNNFNLDQTIIIGIQPDSFPNTTGPLQLAANLNTTNSSPLGYGSPFSFTTKIQNTSSTSFSGSFCAQVFDTSNHLMGTIQTLTGQTIAVGATSGTLTFATTAMYDLLAEDYYHVQVMYQSSGSSSWTAVANSSTYFNYNIVDITNDTDIHLNTDLSVTSGLPVPLGGTISVFSQIANYGSSAFSGTFEAILINLATGTSYTVQTLPGSTLGSELDDDFTYSGSVGTAPAGTYALEVKHQYNGVGNFYVTGNQFYANPILVHIGSAVGVNAVTALENKVSIYPNPASDVININATGVSLNEIRIVDINGREVRKIDGAGQSALSVPVAELATGVYFVQLQSGSDVATKKIVIAK